MKKLVSISFVVISVLTLMFTTMFPHHHHEGANLCLITEQCEKDGAYNDEHTSHNMPQDGESDREDCPFRIDVYKQIADRQYVSFSVLSLLWMALLPDTLDESMPYFYIDSAWNEEVEFIFFSIKTGACGMRAPPVA